MPDIIVKTDLPTDVQTEDTVDLMVAGANGQAARVAPCLFSDDPAPSEGQLSEARLVLLGAIVRWSQQRGGGVQQQTAGPFSVGFVSHSAGYRLWPTEITQLQDICSGGGSPSIGAIDTAPAVGSGHLPWCDVMFGSTSCSCGYDIAGRPIYENAPGL